MYSHPLETKSPTEGYAQPHKVALQGEPCIRRSVRHVFTVYVSANGLGFLNRILLLDYSVAGPAS